MRSLATFKNDIARNRVYVKVEIDESDVRTFSKNLKYASTQGAVTNFMQVREAATEALAFLRSRFPESKTIPGGLYPAYTNGRLNKSKAYAEQRNSSKLNEGWRYRLTENDVAGRSASLIGFRLYHAKETNRRVQTILASLNSGSRAHTIRPKRVDWLKAVIGDGGGDTAIFFWNKYLNIPARKGLHYLEATERFIEKRYEARSTEIQNAIEALVERGIRPDTRLYSLAPFERAPRSVLSQVRRSTIISGSSNFMRAIASEAASVRSLRRKPRP